MKRKQILYSLTLTVAVLFSILFQSFHSYEHLEKQLSHQFCQHDHSHNKQEITHQHKVFEQCAACHFAFSSFLQTKLATYHFFTEYKEISFFGVAQPAILSFPGSLYALRGPPNFV